VRFDQVQQPAAHRRVEVRQVAHRHERHRVQRRGDPLKPATLSVGAQARRINDRCGDRIAQLLDEAVGALDLRSRAVSLRACARTCARENIGVF